MAAPAQKAVTTPRPDDRPCAPRNKRAALLSISNVSTANFDTNAYGVAAGIDNRVEVSVAQQSLDVGNAPVTGVFAPATVGATLTQDIIGVKVRVLGNALAQGTWLPQIAVGAQYHHNESGALMDALGLGTKASGTSYYPALTKVRLKGLLGHVTVADFTLDATRANYNGLFGFQGANNPSYHDEPEISAGVFLDPHVVVGGEYRAMPRAMKRGTASPDNAWKDVFVAYVPNKSVSLTLAYGMLGHIAGIPNSNGLYTSVTASF